MVYTSIARFPGSPRNLRHLKESVIYAMLVTKVKRNKMAKKAQCIFVMIIYVRRESSKLAY